MQGVGCRVQGVGVYPATTPATNVPCPSLSSRVSSSCERERVGGREIEEVRESE